MSKLSPKVLKLIAVTVSCLIAGLIYSYLSSLQPAATSKQDTVVIAAMDIQKNALITADMLKVVPIPDEAIQKDAYRSTEEIIGTTAKETIYAGEQLNKRRLFTDNKMAGFIGMIPDDKRAIAIPITDITGVAGFINPGNFVDVMLISDKDKKNLISGRVLLANMMLLAVNKSENNENKGSNKEAMTTVTLAASPEEAVRLAVAQLQGTLYLTLRPLHPAKHLTLTSEINLYHPTGNDNSANKAPLPPLPSPPPFGRDYTPSAVQPSVPSLTAPESKGGSTINVIRGNTVQSVSTR